MESSALDADPGHGQALEPPRRWWPYLVPGRLERRPPCEELVGQHPQAPVVHCTVVFLALDHLRGQVVQGPTQGAPPAVGGVNRPPEIGDLEVPRQTDQEVLRGADVRETQAQIVRTPLALG